MKNKIALLLIMAIGLANAQAQEARFIMAGKVEFEKKVNMHKFIEDNSWTQEFKDKMPVYRTTYYNLYFNGKESVYRGGKEVEDKWKNFWGMGNDQENVLYNNYENASTISSKQVFEKKFLLQDSLVNIEWRLTNETRTIAGFECRKAVGKMFDSLYVVAFYTDQIVSSAGPEIYQGLPGLILGVAFPRYYTTWFATKVELITPTANDMTPPVKGKKVTRNELFAQLKDTFKWGSQEERQKSFWNTVL